jgi:hypothetical protein
MNEQHKKIAGEDVMKAIRDGHVHMRPRWHFLLLSALSITGAFIVLLTLLYVTSLGFFFLRDSGAWYAPSFGTRGWFGLLHSLPWLLILFVAIFIVILELLVRRYTFVYKKPLVISVIVILALVFLGGLAIAQTPLHRMLMLSARRGSLPPELSAMYGHPLRTPPPSDMFNGQIVGLSKSGFVIVDEGGAGTTTVVLTPETRLPYGEDFTLGERVVVVGDVSATGTVRAFGVREIDEYPNQ